MKKRKAIYAVSALLLLGGVVGMSSCGEPEPTPNPIPDPTPEPDPTFVEKFSVSLAGSAEIATSETVQIVATSLTEGVTGIFDYQVTSGQDFISVNDNGVVTGLKEGVGVVTVTCLNGPTTQPQTVEITCTGVADPANGAYNYVARTYEEKLEILGKLEKYAVDQHLTGITLFENGGYVMYNPRVKRPFANYITGYGMGILSEGEISGEPLKGESNQDWQNYYHSYAGSNNKQNFNYLDDTGSESADLYGYVTSTYYGQKPVKVAGSSDYQQSTSYEWYPVLTKTYTDERTGKVEFRPYAVNLNPSTGLATKYKVYVKTGEDGLVYNTLSNMETRKKFKNRGVELEDYATPFMLLLNGNINLARSTDYISDSSNSTLKGASAFFNASKNNGDVIDLKNTFYKLVGLELNPEENSITFTFNTPVNQFTAMTNLSSSLNSPIPLDFIETLAGDLGYKSYDQETDENRGKMWGEAMKNAYGTVTKDHTTITPVDNLLSLAPYMLEAVDTNYIVYKRNPSWVEFKDVPQYDETVKSRYKIEGIKLVYIPGAESSTTAAFDQFISSSPILDAVSIPQERLQEFINDPRTTTTEGDSTFKLNLNTCTQEEWDEMFGTGNWTCEPLMSNDKFVNALSYAIDRETFANNRGVIPSQSYFSPSYLWDPENGKSYNSTEQHAAAIANYSPDTYGYNFDLAVRNFDEAIAEMVEDEGVYQWNSQVEIRIDWMNPTDNQEYGNEIVEYLNRAFQETDAYANGFRINFNTVNGTNDYQQVYEKMRKGTFDIAFGSVSGMQLDPLGFMEVLKSNNVTGFTLSRGPDTSKINVDDNNYIIFEGKTWSFDALWDAAYKGVIVSEGDETVDEPITASSSKSGFATQNIAVNYGGDYGTQNVNAWNLAVTLELGLQAAAVQDMVKFKLISDMKDTPSEFVTISITYNINGRSETAALQATYGELFRIQNGVNTETGELTDRFATLNVFLPQVLTENSTGGQISGETLDLTSSAISNVTVALYGSYYMQIGDVITTNSWEVSGLSVKN